MNNNNFLVRAYPDLNIDIVYQSKSRKKKIFVYQALESSYRSTFGNCYFELYKDDSITGGYKNITTEIMGISEPPNSIKSKEDILKYDLQKKLIKFGERQVLTFNLLNFIPFLEKGLYSLKIYLRVNNTFGFDKKGKLIANSVGYFESEIMNFEVLETIETPNKFK